MSYRRKQLGVGFGVVLLTFVAWGQGFAGPQSPGQGQVTSHTPEQRPEGPITAADLFQQAKSLMAENQFSEAIPLLQRAARLAPQEMAIHHYLGYALWKVNDWRGADGEFKTAHRLAPGNPYTCYFLARVAQTLGQPNESIAYYEEILRLGPPIYDTDQRLGQAYLDKGDLGKARIRIEAALKETPWEGSLYYQLGKIDQREHQTAQAREEFAAAERLKGENQDSIRQLLGMSEAIQNRQTPRVLEMRTAILSSDSSSPEILNAVGVLLGRDGLYSEALEPLERAVRLAPDSFESNYNLALTLMRLGNSKEAETQLSKTLAMQPDSPEVNTLLGALYAEQNRTVEAIKRLRAADLASPGNLRILALLGQQYLAGHYVSNAIPCLSEVIRESPDEPNLRYLLIEAYEQEADFQDALRVAEDTARHFPDSARAVTEVGRQYVNLGYYKKARPYAEKAIHLDSTFAPAYDLMGNVEAKDGEYEAAVGAFHKARDLDPGDLIALRGLPENLIRLRRYTEARTELKQAIELHPQDADLYFSLTQAYTRLDQHAEAAHANAIFQELHAKEIAERNAQAPRSFDVSSHTKSGTN